MRRSEAGAPVGQTGGGGPAHSKDDKPVVGRGRAVGEMSGGRAGRPARQHTLSARAPTDAHRAAVAGRADGRTRRPRARPPRKEDRPVAASRKKRSLDTPKPEKPSLVALVVRRGHVPPAAAARSRTAHPDHTTPP